MKNITLRFFFLKHMLLILYEKYEKLGFQGLIYKKPGAKTQLRI
jgi:hypothetical protein